MENLIKLFAPVCLMALCSACTSIAPPTADRIFRDGAVYTANQAEDWAEAVAIKDGHIVYVGGNDGVEAYVGENTKVTSLKGQMLLPGFHDAHIHTSFGGAMLTGCSLEGIASLQGTLDKIASCAESSSKEWLMVENFNLGLFGENGPDKALIDEIVSDRPVVVGAADGHNMWVNSKALEFANITAQTAQPANGVIERYEHGEPSGTLRETARDLITKVAPSPTSDEIEKSTLAAVQAMSSFGITSVIDAWSSSQDIAAFQSLDKQGLLPVRVNTALAYGYGDMFVIDSSEVYDEILANRESYATDRFRINTVKLFADGVLEGETAALVDPYLQRDQHKGNLTFSEEQMIDIITELDAKGIQVFTHAIGDGAVRATLNAIEHARAANGVNDLRHHISHLQLIHPDDVPRFAELDVVANFQALWAYPDEYITELNLPFVGQERVDRMYPIRSVLDTGAVIVGGSDWNVSSMNPLEAIETAILRSDAINNGSNATDDPKHTAVLNASERVDLSTMVRAYTSAAAWSMHQEESTGSIAVGKRADVIVLDRNIFKIDPSEISEAKVLMTLIDGETVFQQAR
ncbi:MAG: amidohydrolase [Pseudomonadales bacterium]